VVSPDLPGSVPEFFTGAIRPRPCCDVESGVQHFKALPDSAVCADDFPPRYAAESLSHLFEQQRFHYKRLESSRGVEAEKIFLNLAALAGVAGPASTIAPLAFAT